MGYALDECYGETYELWQCAKAGSLAGLSLVTLVVALYLFLRRARRERAMSVPVLLLAMVAAEALLCIFHWILSEENQPIAFAVYFVKNVSSALVCYNFLKFACRVFRREELVKRLLWPGLGVTLTIAVSIFVVSVVGLAGKQCQSFAWVMLSSTEFALDCVFLGAGLYTTRKLRTKITMSVEYRFKRQRRLWTLIVINTGTCAIQLAYDIFFFAKSSSDCEVFYSFNEGGRVLVYMALKVVVLLVPMWGVLYVFHEIPARRRISSTPFGSRLPKNLPGSTNSEYNQGGDLASSALLPSPLSASYGGEPGEPLRSPASSNGYLVGPAYGSYSGSLYASPSGDGMRVSPPYGGGYGAHNTGFGSPGSITPTATGVARERR